MAFTGVQAVLFDQPQDITLSTFKVFGDLSNGHQVIYTHKRIIYQNLLVDTNKYSNTIINKKEGIFSQSHLLNSNVI